MKKYIFILILIILACLKFYFKTSYFDGTGKMTENLIPVSKNGLFGYIDKRNHPVIPLEYKELGTLRNSLIIARKDKKFGVINIENQFVVPPIYEYISARTNDLFLVGNSEAKEGIINSKGDTIIPLIYDGVCFSSKNSVICIQGNDLKYFQVSSTGAKELKAPQKS